MSKNLSLIRTYEADADASEVSMRSSVFFGVKQRLKQDVHI